MASSLLKAQAVLHILLRFFLGQGRQVWSWLDLWVRHVPCRFHLFIWVVVHDGLLHEKVIGDHLGTVAFCQLQTTPTVWSLRPILTGYPGKRLFSAGLNRSLILFVLCTFVLHKLLQNFDRALLYLDRSFVFLRLIRLVGVKLVTSIVHLWFRFLMHFFN